MFTCTQTPPSRTTTSPALPHDAIPSVAGQHQFALEARVTEEAAASARAAVPRFLLHRRDRLVTVPTNDFTPAKATQHQQANNGAASNNFETST